MCSTTERFRRLLHDRGPAVATQDGSIYEWVYAFSRLESATRCSPGDGHPRETPIRLAEVKALIRRRCYRTSFRVGILAVAAAMKPHHLRVASLRPNDRRHNEADEFVGFIHVRGAREHNLKDVDVRIPRDALVVFTGVSGSGKSSLAFGTLYAEAQRRYLESVSPYARRLFHQMAVPDVDEIDGLPPAVALQQQRGSPTTRSSVGSVTTLSNLLRMLYSRAGDYPPGQDILYAESFSPNTPQGACPKCHGLGRIYDATEQSMVPDDSLSIQQRAIAAWPPAWHGQNLRDIVTTLGYDVNRPWRELPKRDRDWLLFTDEQPTVPVYAGYDAAEVRRALKKKEEPSYMGTFTGARRYVLHTFATTQSALMKKRVARYLISADCPECDGKRLRRQALSVTFAGRDIAEMSALPLKELAAVFRLYANASAKGWSTVEQEHPEKALVTKRIAQDLEDRLSVLLDLGLGYLALDRSTPTLSPGELQRLRLATQVRSNLFGVVYVLDEPSAGLHPADTEALLRALDKLKGSGNSLFVVEHNLDVIRHADWIVDVGPAAGQHGGQVLYSGRPAGLAEIGPSSTRRHLFGGQTPARRAPRTPQGWLRLSGITRNNLHDLDVAFPLCVLTTVTGVSGSGKSSLVSQALVELVGEHLGHEIGRQEDEPRRTSNAPRRSRLADASRAVWNTYGGWYASTRNRSAVRRGRTWLRTPAFSITYGSCSPRRRRRRAVGTTPADSRSTSPKDGARTAKAKAS